MPAPPETFQVQYFVLNCMTVLVIVIASSAQSTLQKAHPPIPRSSAAGQQPRYPYAVKRCSCTQVCKNPRRPDVMEQQKAEASPKDLLHFLSRGRELHEIKNRLQAAVDATGGAIYEHKVPLDGAAYHDDRWAEILCYHSHELPQYDH